MSLVKEVLNASRVYASLGMATLSSSSSFRRALAVTEKCGSSPADRSCVFRLEVLVSCLLGGEPFFVGDLVS